MTESESCNIDEILKQLKVLDALKQLRENMGENVFMEKFPELTGINEKLDTEIAKQESDLQNKMSECGKITSDELPELGEPVTEPILELDNELPEEG